MTPDKFCFILRGLPSSGKDVIKDLFLNLIPSPELVSVISTDDFFTSKEGYKFDKLQLGEAHNISWLKFRAEVDNGRRIIIINNSNIKNYHYYHYLDYAQRNGYLTSIILIPTNNVSDEVLAKRNSHSIDEFTIAKMRSDFEWMVKKPCYPHEWSDWNDDTRECVKCGARENRFSKGK
jgi:hypothetical protein